MFLDFFLTWMQAWMHSAARQWDVQSLERNHHLFLSVLDTL